MKHLLLLLFIITIQGFAFAQHQNAISRIADSLYRTDDDGTDTTFLQEELKTDIIEDYTRRTEADYDFYDFIYGTISSRQPVNINKASVRMLKSFKLNNIQISNLKNYIEQYGEITSIYELQLVEGFDSALIMQLKPHLEFKLDPEVHKITANNLRTFGSHSVISSFSRILEKSTGYLGVGDSISPAFNGGPDKLLLKYLFSYYDRLRFGITMEKDPGESMKKGFDFYSLHFIYKGKKFIRTFALGDYNLTFGQGLTMSSGFSYLTDPATGIIQSKTNRVSSSTGANENSALKGFAITINPLKNTDLTMFYSDKKLDATIYQSKTIGNEGSYFTTVSESGLHRTADEIARKNSLMQKVMGGNLQYKTGILRIGATIFNTAFSEPMRSDNQPYQRFRFTGKNLINYGTDISLSSSRLIFFSDFSADNYGGSAWLAGITSYYSDIFGLSLHFRNYSKNYHNFFSRAFSTNSRSENETGFYAGFFTNLNNNLILTASADHYKFPWIKYRIDAPSYGCEYIVQLKYKISEKDIFLFRYSFTKKLIPRLSDYENDELLKIATTYSGNQQNFSAVDYPVEGLRTTLKLQFQYSPATSIVFRNRLDILLNKKNNTLSHGYLLYQDLIISSFKKTTTINMRYALFDTDGYDERIYAYESDVLYAFSVPAYYYKGSRFYLILNYNINRNISFWFKYAVSYYSSKSSIGEGLDEIQGNKKSEVKMQLILKI